MRPNSTHPGIWPVPFALTLGAAVLAGCSSSDSAAPDVTAPAANAFVQNRTLDPTGQTVSVTFSEPITSATAEVAASYTFSGGINVSTATRRINGTTVDLVLDAPAIPGIHTIAIAAGMEDASGNLSQEVTATALTSTDTTAPAASSIAGTTVPGVENDTIEVVFNDAMIQSEVETLANWTIESPLGTTFDATGATVAYNTTTHAATITLDSGAADQNLQTFDPIHASFTTMRDIGGNTIGATTIGAGAVNAVVGGDTTPPTLLAAAPSGMDVVLTFSEDVAGVETADLQSVALPTGTEIVLTDVSQPAAPATGDVTLTGAPDDADGVTISDGTTSVVFEFDYAEGGVSFSGVPSDQDSISLNDGVLPTILFEFDALGDGVVGAGAIDVNTGIDAPATAAALASAINAQGFDITAQVVGPILKLTNDGTGAAGNTSISVVNVGAAFSTTDFTGGGVASGSVTVAVDQLVPANTATALAAAIDGNAFNITTSSPSGASFNLSNDNNGPAGNVAISKTDVAGKITVNGMSGGADAVIEAPTASTASGTPLQGTSTFSFAPAVGDTLRLYGITDLAGNQMLPMLSQALVAANSTAPALNSGNSVVTANTGEDNDTILVKFSAPIHPDGATDPANYALNDGSAVDIASASFEFDGLSDVRITLDGSAGVDLQAAAAYDISVNNLRNLQGTQLTGMDSDTGIAPLGDTTAPTVGATDAKLDPSTANAVIITFSEALSETAAADTANYTLTGNATTAAELIHPRAVRVTFTTQPVVSDMITIAAAAQTDLAGNAAGGTATVAVTAGDSTAPTVLGIAATTGTDNGLTTTRTERDEIDITFDGPVVESQAIDPANYAITSGSAISLQGASITMSSVNDSVHIRLASDMALDTGESISVTVSNVTDLAGNAIVAAATVDTVGGDSTAPASAVAFVNVKADATGATVDVEFDEPMDAATTMATASWTGSNGQSATSVTRLSSQRFRVAFDAAIGASDTVDVATPTDRANNAGATINVDPVE